RGIYIWGLRPKDNSYEMNISIRDFHKLKPVIRKTKIKVTIRKRIGLPFILHRYRKQRLLLAGLFLCIGIIGALSCFVWNIDISGNQKYTDEALLEFLQEKNVNNGMLTKKIDCTRIVKDIRKEYHDIIWVSAYIDGTRLMIQVKENEDSIPTNNQEEEAGKAYDIIADETCIITEIVTRKGIAQVKEGQQVNKGDILVSGMVPVKNDAGEIVDYQKQKADANITGEIVTSYQNSIANTHNLKKELSIEKKEYYIILGKYRISLGGIKNKYTDFEEYSIEYKLKLTEHFYLPIACGQRIVNPYEKVVKRYTEKELQQILTSSFLYDCEELKKKGVEILGNDVKIYRESQTAEAKGSLTVRRSIGVLRESKEIEIINENEQSGELADGNDGNSH
ncbi:MAG: sporulation protein YqfD, partial [Dorea sp.]